MQNQFAKGITDDDLIKNHDQKPRHRKVRIASEIGNTLHHVAKKRPLSNFGILKNGNDAQNKHDQFAAPNVSEHQFHVS